MIKAGKIDDISWSSGTWLILDIGFSNNQKSCAISVGDGKVTSLTFYDAISKVIDTAKSTSLLNLVIEAPLSVAFDRSSGNPKISSIDKKGKQSRPWYVGAGCTVMVAAMYLMRELYESHPSAEIKLFEGFVSFKDEESKSDHLKDVKLLRTTIKKREVNNFCEPNKQKEENERIISAFKLMNMDLGIPPVIKVDR